MKLHGVLFCILLFLGLKPLQGQILATQDFEFADAIENHGYDVDIVGPSTVIAETREAARYTGSFGLYVDISSRALGSVVISTPQTQVALSGDHIFLSLFAFHRSEDHLIFRMYFSDDNGNVIGMDFGSRKLGWNDTIYSTGVVVFGYQWDHLMVNIMYYLDYAFADGRENKPFLTYQATTLDSIEMYIDTEFGTEVISCIDQIEITSATGIDTPQTGDMCDSEASSSEIETNSTTPGLLNSSVRGIIFGIIGMYTFSRRIR